MSESPSPTRTAETMLAELVHHMAEMTTAQKETNHLLALLQRALGQG